MSDSAAPLPESDTLLHDEQPAVVVCPSCHSTGLTKGASPEWGRNYLCAHCGMAWVVRAVGASGAPAELWI